MKFAKTIVLTLSIPLLCVVAANVAWARPGGGFSGGHGGGSSSGHSGGFSAGRGNMHEGGGGYRGGYHGGYDHGYGRGYYGGFYGGLYLDPWAFGYDAAYPGAFAYGSPIVVAPQEYSQGYVDGGYAPQQAYVPPTAPQTAPANVWYYCAAPAGYYPYVKACSGTWQVVPSTPPR